MQLRANLTNRLVLKVADKRNSVLVLDEPGAERLLGRGHLAAKLSGEGKGDPGAGSFRQFGRNRRACRLDPAGACGPGLPSCREVCAVERRFLLVGAKPTQQLSLRLVAARAVHGGNKMG